MIVFGNRTGGHTGGSVRGDLPVGVSEAHQFCSTFRRCNICRIRSDRSNGIKCRSEQKISQTDMGQKKLLPVLWTAKQNLVSSYVAETQ